MLFVVVIATYFVALEVWRVSLSTLDMGSDRPAMHANVRKNVWFVRRRVDPANAELP